MDPSTESFLTDYARCLRLGEATAFVGSGLSLPAGYPDWRGLVGAMANEIGLDAEEAHDLPALVQFFLNEESGQRGRLNDFISTKFADERPIPDAVTNLAGLPLREIWTTNYDTLIERALRNAGRRVQVKSKDAQLTVSTPSSRTVVFKMHGTVEDPGECVIARDDYETYTSKRPGIHYTLAERLQSKRFLFLGAGLNDPTLNRVFSLLRQIHGSDARPHWAVMRRGRPGRSPKEEHEFRTQQLWLGELKRHGVRLVHVDDFREIPALLHEVEHRVRRDTVFISGAHPDDVDAPRRAEVVRLGALLGTALVRRKLRTTCGFGNTVGGAVISGALSELNRNGTMDLESALHLWPFPQEGDGPATAAAYKQYREAMIRDCGVAIYMSGLRSSGEMSTGVFEEFAIASRRKLLHIPVGAFGGAAAEVWKQVDRDYGRLALGMDRSLFDTLNDASKSPEDLLATVDQILAWWTEGTR